MQKKTLMLAAAVPLLWACQDSTGPENAGQVTVRFDALTSSAAASAQAPTILGSAASSVDWPIMLDNGAVIDNIQLIVSEIELEGTGGECLGGEDNDCQEVEVGPFLVSLPDDGRGESEVRGFIPDGIYDQLEFELENLEADDDDDGSKQAAMADLLAQLQLQAEGFRSDASMVVRGTCNGGATPLTVYFAGEFELEKELAPPFVVPGDQSILVHLDPMAWLTVGGQPIDLCAVNGQMMQLEGELDFENGVEVESGG